MSPTQRDRRLVSTVLLFLATGFCGQSDHDAETQQDEGSHHRVQHDILVEGSRNLLYENSLKVSKELIVSLCSVDMAGEIFHFLFGVCHFAIWS